MHGYLKDFLYGGKCSLGGIKKFFTTPKYWWYSIIPIIIILVFYLLALYPFYYAGKFSIEFFNNLFANISVNIGIVWLNKIIAFLINCGEFALKAVTLITLVITWVGSSLLLFETLFDISGCVFFDKLAEVYCKDFYKRDLSKISLKDNVDFASKSIIYAIKHFFIGIVMLLISLIPIVGWIFFIPYKSTRVATSALLSTYCIMNVKFPIAREMMKRNKMALLGFGLVGFAIMLIPFTIVFVLPGLIIGGVDLYISHLEGKEVRE